MKKKRDSDSDRDSSSSSSYCDKTDCSQCSASTDYSTSEDSNQPRIQSPQLRKGKKNASPEKNVRSSSSSSKSSNSRSSIVENPKPKFDWKSFTKPTKNSPTKERQQNKAPSPSITEKKSKIQTSTQKKNEVIESSKPNSSESSSKKSIMPELRALDNKSVKTKRITAENEHETDGSELESDFFIEKPSMRIRSNEDDESVISISSENESESGTDSLQPKKPAKKRAKKEIKLDDPNCVPAIKKTKVAIESTPKKLTSRPKKAEGKECTRFSREEDAAIIAFFDQSVRTVDLMKHLHETFPDRQPRNKSSVRYHRKSILKKCQETILGIESQKE